jgi:hypothetical protein
VVAIHGIVVDKDKGILYELYNASLGSGGTSWEASSGAILI